MYSAALSNSAHPERGSVARYARRHSPFGAGLAVALLLSLAPAARGQTGDLTAADLLDFIPAVVADYGRGEQLTGAEVTPLIAPQVQAMLANGIKPTPEQVRSWTVTLVDGIINQRLVLREALRAGATLNTEEGKRLVEDQRKLLGKKNFERSLRLQGVTADELAQHLAENAAVDRWLASTAAPADSITDQDAQAFFDAHPDSFRRPGVYHVAHLFVSVPADASEADVAKARDRIAAWRAEIAGGTPFAESAARHSDCPSKMDGGDLGPLPQGRLPAAFESVALSLEPGQISEPVRSPSGWHLIRGGRVVPGSMLPFAEVRETILAGLRDARRETLRADLIRRLREEAHVTVYVTAPPPAPTPGP
jgi:parvulin-like peptidyl-prolyl isomerase